MLSESDAGYAGEQMLRPARPTPALIVEVADDGSASDAGSSRWQRAAQSNVRSWRQAALRGRPAEEIKSPQGGGCGKQFVESRWPYLDGLVSLGGPVDGAWLGIGWTRALLAHVVV